MTRLALPEKLTEAVAEAKRISNFEGKRRQMQFIGKLMRKLEATQLDGIRTALIEQHTPSALETQTLHQAEMWRDRLVNEDDALGQWITLSPSTDSQQLRALVRQARKDAKPEKPGAAVRHGRAYRDIFQIVRAQLLGENHLDDAPDLPHDPGVDV
jgi:ribosome-associated protein